MVMSRSENVEPGEDAAYGEESLRQGRSSRTLRLAVYCDFSYRVDAGEVTAQLPFGLCRCRIM
jgi:hypothetical protein